MSTSVVSDGEARVRQQSNHAIARDQVSRAYPCSVCKGIHVKESSSRRLSLHPRQFGCPLQLWCAARGGLLTQRSRAMSWRQGSNRRRPLRLHSQRLILCQSLAPRHVSRSAGWKVAKVSVWICRGDRIVWRILLQHQHWSCHRSICSVAESRVLYLRRLRLCQVLATYRPACWKAAGLRRDLPRYPTEQRSTRSIVAGRVVDQRLSLRPCRLCGWKMIRRNLLRCQH